ncbi:MAG: oligosaccharide flippase family protein [Patescibacteria group bacterium]
MDIILDKLTRLFRTDIRYIVRGGFWLTTSKVLSTLAFFISSVAFANLLPAETYGTFQYVLSIMSLLAIPTLYGIEASLTRSIARGNYGDIDLALRTRLKWGVIGGIGSLGVAIYYYYMGNTTLCLAFLIVAMFVPFMDSFHIYTSVLSGKKKFNLLARDEVATRMSVAFLLAGLVFFTDNVLYVLFAFFFSTTLLRFLFLRHVFRTEPRNELSDPKMITYGKHLTALGIFSRVSTQMDKILVFHYSGSAMLAAFFLSFAPMKSIQGIFNGLTVLAMPKFSNNSLAVLRKTLPHKLFRLYIIIIPIVVAYEFSAHFFFSLLFPLYPESIFMSQLIFLQLLFYPISLLGTSITAHEEKKKLYINSSVYSILRVALLLLLVPTYGAIGAVAAIMITLVTNNLLLIYLFFKPSDQLLRVRG